MIIIKYIQLENGVNAPERELTKNEQLTVTSTLLNGVDAIYYQGDEPFREPIEQPVVLNWLGLEQQLRYSPLFAKAFNDATEKGLSLFMVTLVNGKSGQASENSLAFAFSVLGVTWTENEILELNTILENNNFTIRL
jgi:actin-related protein